MNSSLYILVITFTLFGWAVADLPKKAPISKYNSLYTNSPFTSKPPVLDDAEAPNPLEDYALNGISPIIGGHLVTLLNKKKPDERISVSTNQENPKHGFKILEVIRKPGDPLGTTVRMSSGSLIGTVSFDEKLLTLTSGPKAQQGHPPQVNQAPVQPGQTPAARQPRPRVVIPPTGAAAPVQATPQGRTRVVPPPHAPGIQPNNPAGTPQPQGTSTQSNTRPNYRNRR